MTERNSSSAHVDSPRCTPVFFLSSSVCVYSLLDMCMFINKGNECFVSFWHLPVLFQLLCCSVSVSSHCIPSLNCLCLQGSNHRSILENERINNLFTHRVFYFCHLCVTPGIHIISLLTNNTINSIIFSSLVCISAWCLFRTGMHINILHAELLNARSRVVCQHNETGDLCVSLHVLLVTDTMHLRSPLIKWKM